jgi:hypothetical protein
MIFNRGVFLPSFALQDRHHSTQESSDHGKKLVQCLLTELGMGAFDTFIDCIRSFDDDKLRESVDPIFVRLLEKVRKDESWTFSDGKTTPIAKTHTKEMRASLLHAIKAARVGTSFKVLKSGNEFETAALKEVENLLRDRNAATQIEQGTEADERRDMKMYDHETLALYESILRNTINHQPIDCLTLGSITAFLRATGLRTMNVRALTHSRRPPHLTCDHVHSAGKRSKVGAA